MAASATPALFLDRDGVINVNHGYVYKPRDVDFIDGIFGLIKRFNDAGYKPVIITNQSGIARGMYSEDEFFHVMDLFQIEFKKCGIGTIPVYFCPHHPEYGEHNDCDCRKPKPGLFTLAATEQNIDMARSIMIGDKLTDAIAASRAGVGRFVLFDPMGEEETKLASHRNQITTPMVQVVHTLDDINP
ncbi:D-glycero-alpha-D-manno-heptose-1,7-bisphosphate 7-phosphatase [Alteromonas facilis]|uniref:D-glycero-alpha-D-manno-heptose-1,7-bisphosphate 7-phosphatase n=1 Tax=Alteromonas facilis TaxID=2048004 RepID=UPI000C2865BF|nr:HAD family hydrolase [Alteromonas facilis]